VGSEQSWSKEGTVRHRQSKEASILWSNNEETWELLGERHNARNNARCTKARKATHGLDRQHQDVDRTPHGRVNQKTEINGESTSMVWPTLGSRTAKEQNRTVDTDLTTLSSGNTVAQLSAMPTSCSSRPTNDATVTAKSNLFTVKQVGKVI